MKKTPATLHLVVVLLTTIATLSVSLQPSIAEQSSEILEMKQAIDKKFDAEHVEDVFFVKYKDGVTSEVKSNLHATFNAEPIHREHTFSSNLEAISVSSEQEAKDEMLKFALDPNVEYVEVPHIGEWAWTDYGTTTLPETDWNATNHWYFEDTKLPELWDDQSCATGGSDCGGDSSVVVAVLDSGLAYEDSSLSYEYFGDNYSTVFADASEIDNGAGTSINLWENTAETGGSTGNDDDSNGVCDDEHGVDFGLWYENDQTDGYGSNCSSNDAQKEGHPNDDHGHGTYVTGLIASLTDNGASSVGSAHNVQIMPLKISAPFGGPNSYFFYEAVVYAVDNGADVIQVSSGWSSGDSFLNDAANYAYANNVVMISASGNGYGNGIDYPAAYSKVIAVGAVNNDGSRSNYSDYGSGLSLVAPVGEGGVGNATWHQTLDCFDDPAECSSSSDFTSFSNVFSQGTSFAAPQVSAAAALIKGRAPNLDVENVRFMLTYSATDVGVAGKDNETGYGVLNVENVWNKDYFTRSGWESEISSYWEPELAHFMVNGDFNGDNNEDVAVFRDYSPSSSGMKIFVFLSNGSSSFTMSKWEDSTSYYWDSNYVKSMDVADVNNDGNDDLILIRKYSPTQDGMKAFVFLSNGSNSFTKSKWGESTSHYWNLSNIHSVSAGDFNNDGNEEVAILRTYTPTSNGMKTFALLSNGSNTLSINKWNQNTTSWWNLENVKFMTNGDFNNDGNTDLALLRKFTPTSNGMKVFVLLSNGSNSFTQSKWTDSSSSYWNFEYIYDLVTGDFNNDSNSDVTILRKYTPTSDGTKTFVLLSNGSTSFAITKWDGNDSSNWNYDEIKLVNVGDFNNDGNDDIAYLRSYGPTVNGTKLFVLKSNGSSSFSNTPWNVGTTSSWYFENSHYMVPGDFNNDSTDEIAVLREYNDTINGMKMVVFDSI